MGGDFAPRTNVEGAIQAQAELPESTRIVPIGDSKKAKEILAEHNVKETLFDFVHTTQVVEMGVHPTRALKQKPDSSIKL